MKTALVGALVIFGVAIVISMAVAGLIKVLFVTIRRIAATKKAHAHRA